MATTTKRSIGLGWAALAVVVAAAPACGGDEPSAGPNPCGIEEHEPNDAPGSATGVAAGDGLTGCLGSASDVDYLKVTAPSDKTGGYLVVSLGEVGTGTTRVVVYDDAGTGEMGRFSADAAGGTVAFFLAVAPGQSYRLAVSDVGGTAATMPYTYKLSTTYTAVADSYEPNDTRDTAAAISVGTPIQAFTFAGREGVDVDPATYDDYYHFTAAAGMLMAKLEDVPPDLAARLFLYAPDGSELARVSSGLKGGALTLMTPLPLQPGEHVISVALWTTGAPESMAAGTTLPSHFTQPYKLTLTQ